MYKRILLSLCGALVLGVIIFIVVFLQELGAAGPLATATSVTVQKGQGVRAITAMLKQQGVIAHPWVMELQVKFSGATSSFQAGTFTLPAQVSIRSVVNTLTATPSVDAVTVLVPPKDLPATDIGSLLESAGVISKEDFMTSVQTTDSRTIVTGKSYPFLAGKPAGATLEGFLFPDTYTFYKHADAAHVLAKFLDAFQAKVADPLATQIQSSGHSLYEIITLASILDKEVKTDADRKVAAGIFWKRITMGMALQSDATIRYVVSKPTQTLTSDDLATPSPYNTYLNKGLPPGPIGNPSLSSIRAAASPEDSSYLYFITKADGSAVFSKTYDEHLANKAKYLP